MSAVLHFLFLGVIGLTSVNVLLFNPYIRIVIYSIAFLVSNAISLLQMWFVPKENEEYSRSTSKQIDLAR